MSISRRCLSFGDICNSRYWLSFEVRRYWRWQWLLKFGPTYNGTTHGIVAILGFLTIIGHRRGNP